MDSSTATYADSYSPTAVHYNDYPYDVRDVDEIARLNVIRMSYEWTIKLIREWYDHCVSILLNLLSNTWPALFKPKIKVFIEPAGRQTA